MPTPKRSVSSELQTALSSTQPGLTPFTGVISFGVGEDKKPAQVFHCRFESGGKVKVVLQASGASKDDPVVLVVMKQSDWKKLAECAQTDAPKTIFELEPNITGHLPTFIRHLHTVVGV